MTYLAMARRYRPQVFSEVAAQDHITETLLRAIESDRVAAAYLFTGPRGSGKTTVARLLAKAVNCDKPKKGEPCGKCESCTAITEGRSLDVLEIDGASNNSVEDVRELRENVRYAASSPGKRKVYILDEVHMLSAGAFNALLKTLEEPPSHVVFAFATTEVQKVPQTILSRCQRFDFRRLTIDEIHKRLQYVSQVEKVKITDAALFMLAKQADGSLRDGLSHLDQVLSVDSESVDEARVAEVLGLVREETYLDWSACIANHDSVGALALFHDSLRQGTDASAFALGLVEHLRNLLLLSVDAGLSKSVQLGELHLQRAKELAQQFLTEDLLFLLNRAAAIYEDTRRFSHPVVVLEAAMIELARYESRVLLSEVLERIDGGGGGGAPSGPTSRTGRGSTTRSTPRSTPKADTQSSSRSSTAGGPSDTQGTRAQLSSGALTGQGPASEAAALLASSTSPFAALKAITEAPARTAEPSLDERFGGAPQPGAAAVAALEPLSDPSVPAALAPDGKVHLQWLQENWLGFTKSVQTKQAMMAHCLSEGLPTSLQDNVLYLQFSNEQSFARNLLSDSAKLQELESHLKKYFGKVMKVRLDEKQKPGQTPAAGAPVESNAAARLTSEDVISRRHAAAQDIFETTPRVKEILDLFEGEILDDGSSEGEAN